MDLSSSLTIPPPPPESSNGVYEPDRMTAAPDGSSTAEFTFEDLVIDETLSDVERVAKYVKSAIALQRLVHVKMLGEISQTIHFDATCRDILPLLEALVTDSEFVVRQHLASQFPPVCELLITEGGPAGYTILTDQMLGFIATLLADGHPDVRSAASTSLVQMALWVKPDDQMLHILALILPLVTDDNEDLRMSAVILLNELAETMGIDLCHQFVVPMLTSLTEDPVFRVRKTAALNFANACRVAGPEDTATRLLPAYLTLSKDKIWGVRKACAESIVDIASAINEDGNAASSSSQLIPLLHALSADPSKWVRLATFQNLGPFLVTLPTDHLTPELIELFAAMASHEVTTRLSVSLADASMLKYHCAYSLPGVAATLGPERWLELAMCYADLTLDEQPSVRRTLAFSLHAMARVLGPDATECNLIPAFEQYLHDEDSVKIGIISNLSAFLSNLNQECREQYLPILDEISFESVKLNWRFREIICDQLPALCPLFSTKSNEDVLMPLALKLLSDDVASVREASYKVFPTLLSSISQDARESLIQQVITLGHSSHYKDRQNYIHICRAFITATEEDNTVFQNHLAIPFLELGLDPVSSVRLSVANVLGSASESLLLFLISTSLLVGVLTAFRKDVDDDIRTTVATFSASLRAVGVSEEIPDHIVHTTSE